MMRRFAVNRVNRQGPATQKPERLAFHWAQNSVPGQGRAALDKVKPIQANLTNASTTYRSGRFNDIGIKDAP